MQDGLRYPKKLISPVYTARTEIDNDDIFDLFPFIRSEIQLLKFCIVCLVKKSIQGVF